MPQKEHEPKQLPLLAVDDDAATRLLQARMLDVKGWKPPANPALRRSRGRLASHV